MEGQQRAECGLRIQLQIVFYQRIDFPRLHQCPVFPVKIMADKGLYASVSLGEGADNPALPPPTV